MNPAHNIICHGQTGLYTGENILLTGPSNGTDYSFKMTFKILTDSTKPPEGGVLLFCRYKNFKNYYSYHFCLFKKKIELIKRIRGKWTTIFEAAYNFEIGPSYAVDIRNVADSHQCRIDGRKTADVEDADLQEGCIGIGTKYCAVEFRRLSMESS